MTTKSSDAERLLNTIVAARVRLAGLQGDHGKGIDIPLPETNSAPPVQTNSAPPAQTNSAPPVQTNSAPDIDNDLFSTLSESVSDLDYDEGLENHSHTDGHKSLVLGIDPMDEPPDHRDDESPPSVSDIEPEEDPFSFIDLLPPDHAEAKEPPKEEIIPSTAPPPVREKPTMPLPVGMAAGAPPSGEKATSSKHAEPIPTVLREEPRAEQANKEPASYQLQEPREVAPRILDPNRSILEVDVFEDEAFEGPTIEPPAEAPRLTDSTRRAVNSSTSRESTKTEDELFDTITEAMAVLEKGDIRTAHQLFGDVLDWIPSHLEARIARGRCNRDLGDTVSALSDFKRAQQQNPLSPVPHIETGDLFFAKKDYLRAISHYDDALSIDPQNALTLCRRGICHHHRKRPESAVDDLVLAQRIDPEIPNIDRYIRMVRPNRRR